MKEFRKELIMKSTATLKRMLKNANPEEAKEIKIELNCRGIYSKVK